MRTGIGVLLGLILGSCQQPHRLADRRCYVEPYQRSAGSNVVPIVQVFDTGENPDGKCKDWSAALELARKMAGCDAGFKADPDQKCQKAVRKCSPGCNICENLKPGGGADTDFGPVPQWDEPCYATTNPGFWYGYDSKFDPSTACAGNVFQLARVMVHEAIHACRMAGGATASFDSDDYLRRCPEPQCCTDAIAPVKSTDPRICGG